MSVLPPCPALSTWLQPFTGTKGVFRANADILDYSFYCLVLLLNLNTPPGVV